MINRLLAVVFVAVAAYVTPVFADGATATKAVETVFSTARGIAAGEITQVQAAQALGNPKTAASLFAAITTLQKNKVLVNGHADFATIRGIIEKQDGQDASAVVARFVAASQSKDKTIASAFGQTAVPKTVSYNVEPNDDGMDVLAKVVPTHPVAIKTLQGIVSNNTRAGRTVRSTVAAAIVAGLALVNGACSLSAREWCAQQVPNIVLKGVAMGASPEFRNDGLAGFPKETPNYVGTAEQVVGGMDRATSMGVEGTLTEPLLSCIRDNKTPTVTN